MVVYGAWKLQLGLGYARPLYPEVYGVELGFGIVKLDVVCMYPCPYMLAVVCCSIPRFGAKPSMVVQLWKWFTGWAEGFAIVVLPADGPVVCGLVCEKINSASGRRRINISITMFFLSHCSINLHNSSSVLLLASLTQN
jgi:hypothetical protein